MSVDPFSKQTGGKRKQNKSLKAWVAFVKKVQKEEKLSYKDAIHRAKVRKDKGEKWMMGGSTPNGLTNTPMDIDEEEMVYDNTMGQPMEIDDEIVETPANEEIVQNPTDEEVDLGDSVVGQQMNTATYGGKRRRTMRKRAASRGRARGKTARKSRGRGKARGKSRGRH
jgi:hypothetical protein